MSQRKALRPEWLPAVALSGALALAMLVWDPRVGDLAAQVFRTELFDQAGLGIWNANWYGGHYTLTYSVLFPPAASVLGPRVVGTIAVVASAYLFDRLVRDRWGAEARWATLWFAAGVVTLLADGQLTFALGVAFALATLRCLQLSRTPLAVLAATACTLSSPVAAVFLAGVLLASSSSAGVLLDRFTRGWRRRWLVARSLRGRRVTLEDRTRGPALAEIEAGPAVWIACLALALTLVPNIVFPGSGEFPFAFSSFIAIPLWCGSALYLTRSVAAEERALRRVILGYAIVATATWLVPNAMGGNAVRLGALFGGPVVAAVLLAHRPRLPVWFLVLFLAGSLYWQLTASVTQIARAVGDPSTSPAYFVPLKKWLRAHGGVGQRIEVPPTANHWESAYLAPQFDIARGWLRQIETTRDDIFYAEDGRLAHRDYSAWLHDNAVRFVALPDAPLDYSSDAERRLILSDPSYLEPRWMSEHWRVYEVTETAPLVQPLGGSAASVRRVGHEDFALEVSRPGDFLIRVNFTPYWSIARGEGCLLRRGKWTLARVSAPGIFRVAADFSLPRAWKAMTGAHRTC